MLSVFLFILCLGMTTAVLFPDPSLDAEWDKWKKKFAKSYSLVGSMGTVQRDIRKKGSCCWESVGINVAIKKSHY